jgi:DNA-binding NarL/FixJ family response regulator
MKEEPSTIRVFLVDDHPAVRHGLGLVLTQLGFIVCGEAEDRAGALTHPGLQSADVVVVDLSLAHETGFPLIEELHVQNKPVVVYSMHEDSTQVRRAFAAGALGYVTKRDVAGALADALHDVLAGRQYVSQRAAVSMAIAQPAADSDVFGSLSKREMEIYERLGLGDTTGEIGEKLVISSRTVESYCSRIIAKLGLNGMRELRRQAIQYCRDRVAGKPSA